MTFEDIDKLNYEVFTGKAQTKRVNSRLRQQDEFRPSDILDIEDDGETDDEILRKFTVGKKAKRGLSPSSLKKKASGGARQLAPDNYNSGGSPQSNAYGFSARGPDAGYASPSKALMAPKAVGAAGSKFKNNQFSRKNSNFTLEQAIHGNYGTMSYNEGNSQV